MPLLAAVVVTAAFIALNSTRRMEAPAPLPQVQVVVAARAVPARTALQAGDLALAQVPKTLLGHGEFTGVDAVAGMFTNQALQPGQIVLAGQVTDAAKGALAYRIPPEMRALTVRVDEYSGVGGYPGPGDRVDVVLAVPAKDGTPKVPGFARILVQDVQVLARGPATEAAKADSKAPAAGALTSYTLAVTPDQAPLLALGQQDGQLTLVLRPAPNPGTVPAGVIPESRLSQ